MWPFSVWCLDDWKEYIQKVTITERRIASVQILSVRETENTVLLIWKKTASCKGIEKSHRVDFKRRNIISGMREIHSDKVKNSSRKQT